MSILEDQFQISQIIARFANSFDLKAWDDLKSCLTESLYTDYFDLRGTPPEEMTANRFVDLRREALTHLKTHHFAANQEITVGGSEGYARVTMVIFRKDEHGVILNTHCIYFFALTKLNDCWFISSIVQKVLWSDGDTRIHQGCS